jgi:hypothetical protein
MRKVVGRKLKGSGVKKVVRPVLSKKPVGKRPVRRTVY